MPIQVDHAPSYSQYGAAMMNSGKNQENYARMQALQELVLKKKQLDDAKEGQDKDMTLREKQLAQQKELAMLQAYSQNPSAFTAPTHTYSGPVGYGAGGGSAVGLYGSVDNRPSFLRGYYGG